MILSESLKKGNIFINPQSVTRWELISEMLDLAVKNRELDEADQESVKSALMEREKSMSTGIGKGVAIPHCSTDKVSEIILILALCKKGVDFDSVDNMPVKIAILLIVPRSKLTQHIKTLANIAKLMNNDALREKLITLKSPESIIRTIKQFEESFRK